MSDTKLRIIQQANAKYATYKIIAKEKKFPDLASQLFMEFCFFCNSNGLKL